MRSSTEEPPKQSGVGSLSNGLIVEGMCLLCDRSPRCHAGAGEGQQTSEGLLKRNSNTAVEQTECFDDVFGQGARYISLAVLNRLLLKVAATSLEK